MFQSYLFGSTPSYNVMQIQFCTNHVWDGVGAEWASNVYAGIHKENLLKKSKAIMIGHILRQCKFKSLHIMTPGVGQGHNRQSKFYIGIHRKISKNLLLKNSKDIYFYILTFQQCIDFCFFLAKVLRGAMQPMGLLFDCVNIQ